MRVLVVGASGVIGRRVVPMLLEAGHQVTAMIHRRPPGKPRAGLRHVAADLFDPAGIRAAMAGQEAVINLATAMPSASWKMPFKSSWRMNDRIRSEGVANLVDSALHAGVDTFVQESFAFAYPDCGSDWISEEISLTPSSYNRTLLDAERSVSRFRSAGGRGLVLRFAAFYGADAMQTLDMVRWARRGLVALPGRRDAFISSISHDDAAAAVVASLAAREGVYNVGDDAPLPRAVFFNLLAEALGVGRPRFLPLWSKHLLGSAGEAMARSIRLSSAKLHAETGWEPRWPSVADAWPEIVASIRPA